jgi:sensor c-di-GMP phosphodiesterase-like protein
MVIFVNSYKRSGNGYQHYPRALGTRAIRRLTLEQELRRALARDEFVLYPQPQINLASGEIDTVETAIRWRQPALASSFCRWSLFVKLKRAA